MASPNEVATFRRGRTPFETSQEENKKQTVSPRKP
ncbi:unnamed protein product [Soboliphyme baturini]|uniref:ATP-dependent DNA helicase n=1 Tax=Soboliphyme baturini TaxID=241478 RepID=A0A183IS03_9BILA|nr:unnamed protein product [Soboliphyme baturini]